MPQLSQDRALVRAWSSMLQTKEKFYLPVALYGGHDATEPNVHL